MGEPRKGQRFAEDMECKLSSSGNNLGLGSGKDLRSQLQPGGLSSSKGSRKLPAVGGPGRLLSRD